MRIVNRDKLKKMSGTEKQHTCLLDTKGGGDNYKIGCSD